VRSVCRLARNAFFSPSGAIVSRPSDMTSLRKDKLVVGIGRRQTEIFCCPVFESREIARPYGSWTTLIVNWAFAGGGMPIRKSLCLRSRLCEAGSSRRTLGQLAPSTGAKSGSRPRVRMKVSLAPAEVREKPDREDGKSHRCDHSPRESGRRRFGDRSAHPLRRAPQSAVHRDRRGSFSPAVCYVRPMPGSDRSHGGPAIARPWSPGTVLRMDFLEIAQNRRHFTDGCAVLQHQGGNHSTRIDSV
jgi:hypothetical protein